MLHFVCNLWLVLSQPLAAQARDAHSSRRPGQEHGDDKSEVVYVSTSTWEETVKTESGTEAPAGGIARNGAEARRDQEAFEVVDEEANTGAEGEADEGEDEVQHKQLNPFFLRGAAEARSLRKSRGGGTQVAAAEAACDEAPDGSPPSAGPSLQWEPKPLGILWHVAGYATRKGACPVAAGEEVPALGSHGMHIVRPGEPWHAHREAWGAMAYIS